MPKLWILLLASALLALPATAGPADGQPPDSWWQTSLETVLAWILGNPQSHGGDSIGDDGGDGPALVPEEPQTLEGGDPEGDSTEGNSYPTLDPNG